MKAKSLFFFVLSLTVFAVGCKTNQKVVVAETPQVASKPVYVPSPSPYQPTNTQKVDLLHTTLSVSFDWDKQYLYGLAYLTFKPYFYKQNELKLDAKGFDIEYVKLVDPSGKESDLVYTYDSLKISISLDRFYNSQEKFQLAIKYTAKPNELKVKGSQAISEDKGLYFINPKKEDPNKPQQIWTQGETEASSCWFPTIDSPNEKTTQEIYITVDSSFITVSNGELVYSTYNADGTRTDFWKQEKPHAPYLFMMAVGKFSVIEDKWNDIDVKYLVEPEFAPYAKQIFGNTPEMLSFFSQKLGYKYPWDKYYQIVVRDFVSGAMENTSASIFMEALQVTDRELLDEDWEYIIAHELFHHWFGDLVTCESWSNLPLNESFANYSEYLWLEHKFGKDRADFHADNELQNYIEESYQKQVPLIRFHYEDKEDMFDRHSYDKGGRVLHQLRNYVGDSAFFLSLNKYLKKNEFKPVEIHHLRLALEEVTGEDLNWYFNQWFLSSGHPILSVSKKIESDTLKLSINQLQDTLYSPIFKIPTKISVWKDGKRTVFPFIITKAKEEFKFPFSGKPDLVLFDPDQVILGEVSQEQDYKELVQQYKLEKNYLSRYNAILGLVSKPYQDQTLAYNPILDSAGVFDVVYDALSDPFWNVQNISIMGLSKYSGDKSPKLFERLQEMSSKAKRSNIRSAAIEFFAEKEDSIAQLYMEEYTRGLADSSYLVNSTAVKAFLTHNKEKEKNEKIIQDYKKVYKGSIPVSLASYFIEQKDTLQNDWFEETYNTLERGEKIDFAKVYAKAVNDSIVNTTTAIDLMYKFGVSDGGIYDKFSGYIALWNLSENEYATSKRKMIVEQETNAMLKKVYTSREQQLIKVKEEEKKKKKKNK